MYHYESVVIHRHVTRCSIFFYLIFSWNCRVIMYLSFFFHCVAEGNLFELKKLIFFSQKPKETKRLCVVSLCYSSLLINIIYTVPETNLFSLIIYSLVKRTLKHCWNLSWTRKSLFNEQEPITEESWHKNSLVAT